MKSECYSVDLIISIISSRLKLKSQSAHALTWWWEPWILCRPKLYWKVASLPFRFSVYYNYTSELYIRQEQKLIWLEELHIEALYFHSIRRRRNEFEAILVHTSARPSASQSHSTIDGLRNQIYMWLGTNISTFQMGPSYTVRFDAVTARIWKRIFGSRQYLVGY
jgi:hypothetical protein